MAKPSIVRESQPPASLPEETLIGAGTLQPIGTFRRLVDRTSITITIEIKLHLVIAALTTLVVAVVAAIHI